MDVTPLIPAGRQVIERYGPGGFKVSGTLYPGALLVFPTETKAWIPLDLAALSLVDFTAIVDHGGVEILLLGCGRRMQPVSRLLREGLRAVGIVIDAMDTGAACRTYNVLLGEERRVAAALLPVDHPI